MAQENKIEKLPKILSKREIYEMAETTMLNLGNKGVLAEVCKKKDVMDELESLVKATEMKIVSTMHIVNAYD